MTNEELHELINDLMAVKQRDFDEHLPYSPTGKLCQKAAAEIERLTKELEEAKRHDMRDWHDALERGRKNPI